MMTTTERRRNAYPDTCYVCGRAIEVGQGWLYSDTKSQRSRNRHQAHGTWSKRVKCDRCHQENLSHKWQADNLDNPKPTEPVIRPWSVSSVKNWTLERGEHEGDVALWVVGSCGRVLVSYRDPINSRFCAPGEYQLEEWGLSDRPLSRAAAKELSPRLYAAVDAVRQQERANGEAAAALLTAAGAEVRLHVVGTCWNVRFAGGNYTLWGKVSGNSLSGLTVEGVGPWVKTTAEAVIASTQLP